MERPLIGIPMGDPSGVGPEIVIKALLNQEVYQKCRPVIIGDEAIFAATMGKLSLELHMNIMDNPKDGLYHHGTMDLISLHTMENSQMEFGKIKKESGRAAFLCIEKAVALMNGRELDGLATTPINKEAIKAAEINFIGHTEMLAEMTHTLDPLTLFQVKNLRVFFLSRHISVRNACELVKKERIISYVKKCLGALKDLGIPQSRIAVAALNPHGGEHGMFGREEMDEIVPAIEELNALGLAVSGPIPADSVFHQAIQGKYDAVLSLYHDQGHIATKMVDFERTISVTVGLPFIRTSVDHGTALDIAGKGIASSVSMEEAILLAAQYAKIYKK